MTFQTVTQEAEASLQDGVNVSSPSEPSCKDVFAVERRVYIYTLAEPDTGEIRYVGKTVNMAERLTQHRKEPRNKEKQKWFDQLALDGQLPKIEALEHFPISDYEEWKESERFWISYLRFLGFKLFNKNPGGGGATTHSPETRAKMSATRMAMPDEVRHRPLLCLRGKPRPLSFCLKVRGRKRSPETKAKMRISSRAKWQKLKGNPDELLKWKRKISKALRGRKTGPMSQERKLKLSERLKLWASLHPISDETRMKMRKKRKKTIAKEQAIIEKQAFFRF